MSAALSEGLFADRDADRNYRPLRGACGLHLMRCECRAGADERPRDEEHQAFSVTLLERGTLSYRTRAGRALLGAGWLMLGNPGEGYVCSHEQGDGLGDDCVVLSISERALDDAFSALGLSGSSLRFGRAALLDDVAAEVGLSTFHLMRIFKRSIGVTPHQYLMRIRLLRSIALLRDTAQPVTSVAYEAGWSDLSNFTRTFQRDVGCTPGDYRRGDRKLLQGARSIRSAG